MEKIDFRKLGFELAAQESLNVQIVACPDSKIELYFTAGSERKYPFESYCECITCGLDFHPSVVPKMIKMASDDYPVIYFGEGMHCSKCYYKDDVGVALSASEKKAIKDSDEGEEEE